MEKLKSYLRTYFSNGPKAIFIVVLVLLSITISICSERKTITVSIDGKQTTIVTFKSTFRKALAASNITIGPKDKASVSLDSKIKSGDKLNIKKAVKVSVSADSKVYNILTAESSVADMLMAENIKVRENDKVSPSADTQVTSGMKVVVTRLDQKVVKQVQTIDYATVIKKDNGMEKGTQKVVQEGKLGEKLVSLSIIYEDGKEIARSVISETIRKMPVQKVVAVGTLGVYTPSRGGKVLYTNSIRMKATAYSSGYASTGKSPGSYGYGITASGTAARRDSNGYSSVAVDPRVIPLGTKLYVEGYGYAIAEDTGGAIKGNKIDLYFNSMSDIYSWGSRWTNVYIIK